MTDIDFKPIIKCMEVNTPFKLRKTTATIKTKTLEVECEINIWVRFLPFPRIELKTELDAKTGLSGTIQNFIVNIDNNDIEVLMATEKFSLDSPTKTYIFQPTSIVQLSSTNVKIHSLKFHLFNFINFIGFGLPEDDGPNHKFSVMKLELVCNNWKIELRSIKSSRDTFQTLETQGGYGLTHVGVIKKINDSEFCESEASSILQALRYYLSFIKGNSCLPSLCAGFDKNGKIVWERWSIQKAMWTPTFSCFSSRHTDQMMSLYPRFMKLWESKTWESALTDAIFWYIHSNNSPTDAETAIILSQAVIERLAYEYLVLDRKVISKKDFEKNSAAKNFKKFLSELGIKVSIPKELKELYTYSNKKTNTSPAQIITQIRNSIVHPNHNLRGTFGLIFQDTQQLILWIIELLLLKLCNYEDTYHNRITSIWLSETENVPWSQNKTKKAIKPTIQTK